MQYQAGSYKEDSVFTGVKRGENKSALKKQNIVYKFI